MYDADAATNLHTWRWLIRGPDKNRCAERVLLASRQLDSTHASGGSSYHYHVDGLGTPRQVTKTSAEIIGRYDDHPFGRELTSAQTEPEKSPPIEHHFGRRSPGCVSAT